MRYLSIILVAVLFMGGYSYTYAQSKNEDKIAKKELKKKQDAKNDSIDASQAVAALKNMRFALMADRLTAKAHTSMLQDNMNFVCTDSANAMVQIVPLTGFNGFNVKGTLTNAKVTVSKNGEVNVALDIFGSQINARVMITLYKDSNQARATIMPNFHSGDITLYGKIFPIDVFNELEDALK